MSLKRFQCPSCGAGLDYEDGRGPTMRCPYCNSSVIVPERLRALPGSGPEMDSMPGDDESAGLAEVAQLLRGGNKIAAIKRFREIYAVGLKEAKDAVDTMDAGEAVDITGFNTVTVVSTPGTTLDAAASAEIQALLQSGNKIAAIKLMRERTGLGLAEAKNAVEAMELAFKMAGAFGGTAARNAAPANLVTVVDGGTPLTPTVVGERRGGCGWLFWLVLLLLAVAVFAPLPWADWNETLGLPAAAIPANGQSLFEKYTTDFPGVPGVTLPGSGTRPLLTFGESGTGQGAFSDPRHIALDGRGNLYVADFDTGRVQRFDEEGAFQALFRVESGAPVQAMAASRDGRLYVVQSGKVTRYDGESGDALDTVNFGGLFSMASSISLSPDASLLITTIVPEEGVTRLTTGANSSNRLVLQEPFTGIAGKPEPQMFVAEDGVGNIYVLGRFNNTILKFDSRGRFQNQFGTGDIRNLTANGIAIDSRGRVYVAHFDGVVLFDGESGRRLAQIETDGVPYSVAIGKGDAVWVVTATGKVSKYAPIEG